MSLHRVNLKGAMQLLRVCIKNNIPINLMGPPGIGKSSIVEQVSAGLNRLCIGLLASQCDPTDLGGAPCVINGALERLPLRAIKAVRDTPSVLFLDEITNASATIQAACMQGVLTGTWGDTQMHPESRIVLACNPSNQSAGGNDLALPLINRMMIVNVLPELSEVASFFEALAQKDDTNPALAGYAQELALMIGGKPDLLQFEPPESAQLSASNWATPRAWHRGLEFLAGCAEEGIPETIPSGGGLEINPLVLAGLAGLVGDGAAGAFLALYKLRAQLPSIAEILANPTSAKLPDNFEVGFACLGLLRQVAQTDPCAAWVYGARLADEVKVASSRVLMKCPAIEKFKGSKWFAQAQKVRVDSLATKHVAKNTIDKKVA